MTFLGDSDRNHANPWDTGSPGGNTISGPHDYSNITIRDIRLETTTVRGQKLLGKFPYGHPLHAQVLCFLQVCKATHHTQSNSGCLYFLELVKIQRNEFI
jgi:hypothetical protein